ncbi:MAG TPA: hypothetical protein VN775_06810 [Opitutaceae bacterium]|nr:hypothetical protein [Opitutaceae bacterium]
MTDPPEPQSRPPWRPPSFLRRLAAFDIREHAWAILDHLDARPAMKKAILIGVPALAVAAGLGVWGYRSWAETNSIRIARQWLDAGRLDRAAIAVEQALAAEPNLPASWRLASELAWREGNRSASVEYAKRAAAVGRYGADDVLAWAEASLLADDTSQAEEAAARLGQPPARLLPRALRLAGEIARRGRHFADARDRFQAALEADSGAGAHSLAIDEIPLGIACLQTGPADDRSRGQTLLAKWVPDPDWGAEALRALLADAVAHSEPEAATRWAEGLRAHPRCTLGDIPVCLQALQGSDPAGYRAMLAPLEEKSLSNPKEAAQLLGWLTGIGQGAEALRWGRTLDPAAARRPPIAQGIAEALRATGRWADLRAWVDQCDWGRELGFIGWAYGMAAARQTGGGPRAESFWKSLYADGRSSAAHALFAGDSLCAWGYPREASELLWAAADRPDLAYQAVGTLIRLYQVQHDAPGLCRAFGRLNAMRPADRDIANNYAYYAALTDQGSQTQVGRIAEDNFSHEPGNASYRSTYAFVLVWSGQASRALALIEPVSHDLRKSHAVAFAYGAALAGVGRKSEAKEVFNSINPAEVDPPEAAWIRAALR